MAVNRGQTYLDAGVAAAQDIDFSRLGRTTTSEGLIFGHEIHREALEAGVYEEFFNVGDAAKASALGSAARRFAHYRFRQMV